MKKNKRGQGCRLSLEKKPWKERLINKRGQVWETLIPWLIGAAFLVLMIIVYMILSGKMTGAIEYLQNLFRFGR